MSIAETVETVETARLTPRTQRVSKQRTKRIEASAHPWEKDLAAALCRRRNLTSEGDLVRALVVEAAALEGLIPDLAAEAPTLLVTEREATAA